MRGFSWLPLIAAGCFALGGCARDSLEEAAWQASRVGTAAGEGRRGLDTVGLEAGARVVERFYYVAKYQASVEQRRFAEAAARKVAPKIIKRAAASGRKTPRYLAVRTRPDKRAKTQTNVMVWDTVTEQIVGNNVYDVNKTPPAGALVKFETYSAPYVGAAD